MIRSWETSWGEFVPRENLSGRINGWKSILNALTVHYDDRITASNY